MHIGIIQIKNKKIYIDKKENEIISYYYKERKKQNLSIQTLAILLKKYFFNRKNEVYLYNQDGYKVYKDKETGHKHFYKNNRQDYKKFFKENGISAIMYASSSKKDIYIACALIVAGQAIMYISDFIPDKLNEQLENNSQNQDSEKEIDFIEENNTLVAIDTDYIINSIRNSPYLTTTAKKRLINTEFFQKLSNIPVTEDRMMSLSEKLTDIEIKEFEEDQEQENSRREKKDLARIIGYYNALTPNIIYVDTLDNWDTINHEFIHLLQDDNQYYYIREAFAELLCEEYYGYPVDSYQPQVTRIKVLREIIGEQPIWELNFSGSTKSFENILKDYLSTEEATELLELFQTPPSSYTNSQQEQINSQIDELLSQLYYNMYNRPIESNTTINQIYDEYSFGMWIPIEPDVEDYNTIDSSKEVIGTNKYIKRLNNTENEMMISDPIKQKVYKK